MRNIKTLISSIVIALLLLSLSAGELSDVGNDKKISIELNKGRNIVPNYMSSSLGERNWDTPGVPKQTVNAIFLLNAETKEYSPAIKSYRGEGFVKTTINEKEVEFVPEEIDFFELVREDMPAYNEQFFSNYLVSGMWVYTNSYDAIAEITFSKDDDFAQLFTEVDKKFGGVHLYKGWNFVAITPDMFIESIDNTELGTLALTNIKGNCDITRAAIWDASSQSWKTGSPSEVSIDNRGDVGGVILLKVNDNCKLFGSIGQTTIGPPKIPE